MSRRKFWDFGKTCGMDMTTGHDGFTNQITAGAWCGWRYVWHTYVAPLTRERDQLRARIAELEAERAELVKDRERVAEVHAYLLGEAPIAGRWFGDDLPPKTPKFWWRKHLRQAIDAAREVE